ncbi:hypothetical protein DEO72_LG5g2589 [Vigna unguiculata]|uniref:Uncharacterized protein n=1 Tax=Vigna unguiculata TaxID=3917 RepID=A0A4D6M0B5_VIGUN|nr:hypothetical protein DEO72_LG5g2589 [Vigna unguiculata]
MKALSKLFLLITFMVIFYFSSSSNGVHAKGLRTNPFGIHATHLGQENLEKEQKLKDNEEALVSVDYAPPTTEPPSHNN